MILFVGTKEKAFYIEELGAEIGEDTEITGYNAHILPIKDRITTKSYKHIVIDIEQFIDDATMIAEVINTIKKTSNSNIIVLAAGYNLSSEICQELIKRGINSIIYESILSNQKRQAASCLTGTPTVNTTSAAALETNYVAPINNNNQPQSERKSIAVVGACSRIGTTTQAIQIVKYLISTGKNACYIEANDSCWINKLKNFYNQNDNGCCYMGVDLYTQDTVSEAWNKPYDFYVYDFGKFGDNRFNIVNFIDKDLSIVVMGTAPAELEHTNSVLQKTSRGHCKYIFSFCADSEKEDVLELMEHKADSCYFAPYCPDPFQFSSNTNSLYSNILNLFPIKGSKKSKRKMFWGAKK